MRFLLVLLLIPLFTIPAFAESQVLSTDKGTLDVKLSYENIKTGELTRLPIEFINPMTQKTQVHIDYKIMITESDKIVFQTPSLIHTSEGIINGFKFEFPQDGTYNMKIDVEGILFTPITPETVSFDIVVGEVSAQPINPYEEEGGGCLIATAAYGSELAPQVQLLREIRDNQLMNTESGETIFQTPSLIHTSEGIINGFKFEFPQDGTYNMKIGIAGILFTPITEETVSFDIVVGEASAQPINPYEEEGGGCLIATATYGSEMAPQVQQLRELRDNTMLQTNSGIVFMSGFNELYYSFSPYIADMERENPVFKEAVKLGLTPMLSSLSLLNYVNIDSEQEMLVYGISLIILNLGMYIGLPAFGIVKFIQLRRKLVQM